MGTATFHSMWVGCERGVSAARFDRIRPPLTGDKSVFASAMFLTFSPLSIIGGRTEGRRSGRDWPHLRAGPTTAQVVRPSESERQGRPGEESSAVQCRGALKGAIDGLISSESSIHPSIAHSLTQGPSTAQPASAIASHGDRRWEHA